MLEQELVNLARQIIDVSIGYSVFGECRGLGLIRNDSFWRTENIKIYPHFPPSRYTTQLVCESLTPEANCKRAENDMNRNMLCPVWEAIDRLPEVQQATENLKNTHLRWSTPDDCLTLRERIKRFMGL